jgi:hypothetical protein
MLYQLINLRINRIIAHKIFQREITGEVIPPKCSREFTNLDHAGIEVLQKRMIEALGNGSHCIEMYIQQYEAGSTYNYCNQLLSSENDIFISISETLANKLAYSQTSQNIPGGILVVIDGFVGSPEKKFIAFIKAEMYAGFNLQETTDKLLLSFISNILLAPGQKFYKIGIFIETNERENIDQRTPDDYTILVYDHNLMNKTETGQAAKYFYETFLGCSFSPTDKKLTAEFYYKSQEFIKKLSIPEEEKVNLNTALHTYLKVSPSNLVDINVFSQVYFSIEIRDDYKIL